MVDDTIVNDLDENTRALMLLQAALRNIKAAEDFIPIDNRLTQARELVECSYKELREYKHNNDMMYGKEF